MDLDFSIVLVVMWAVWGIYHRYVKKKTKLKHFTEPANRLELRKKYDKAIALRMEALEKFENLPPLERGSLLLAIGGCYLSMNNPEKATDYFDAAMATVEDRNYPFNKNYVKIIEAYVDCGRLEDATRILNGLIARQSYDKRFRKAEEWRKLIPSSF